MESFITVGHPEMLTGMVPSSRSVDISQINSVEWWLVLMYYYQRMTCNVGQIAKCQIVPNPDVFILVGC